MSAALAAFGVVCALYARSSTGCGRTIDVALLDAVSCTTQLRWAEAVVDQAEPSRLGNGHQAARAARRLPVYRRLAVTARDLE